MAINFSATFAAMDAAPHVLVVDDDQGMRETLLDILAADGIEAAGAASREQARSCAAERAPAVLLVDHRLPDGTGIELAVDLCADDPDLRVLLLTGYASLETAIAAVGHVDAYLTKPMPPELLLRAVRGSLERHRLIRENRLLLERMTALNDSLRESVLARSNELARLEAAAAMVAEAADVEEVVEAAVQTAYDATGARSAALYLVEDDEPFPLALKTARGEGWLLPGHLPWSPDVVEHTVLGEPARAATVVTLTASGRQVGALVLAEPDRATERFLVTLAAHLGLAVQNATRIDRERESVARLSELSAMKSAFLAAVSHELRTPLTAVIGFAQTMLGREDQLDAQQRQLLLHRIVEQGGRLARLVDDLIDATQAERGQLAVRRSTVDVVAVATRVAGSFPDGANPVLVEVPDDLPAVIADATRLEQVLVNLVANACKYSAPGSAVHLSAAQEPGGARRVLLTVRDEGPGIPVDFLPRLFEPFTQADQGDTRRERGLGLGLAIARGLVTAMGGTIGVSTSPGGSTFTVTLPAAGVPAPRAVPERIDFADAAEAGVPTGAVRPGAAPR